MRSRVPLLLLVLPLLIGACADTAPETPGASIYGQWQREVTDEDGLSFLAELSLAEDGTLDWKPVEDAPGHSASSARFTVDGQTLTITDDPDCEGSGPGTYQILVSESELELTAGDDACAPRVVALEGVWRAK